MGGKCGKVGTLDSLSSDSSDISESLSDSVIEGSQGFYFWLVFKDRTLKGATNQNVAFLKASNQNAAFLKMHCD